MGARFVALIVAVLVTVTAFMALDSRVGGLSAPEIVGGFVLVLIVVTLVAQRINGTRSEGPRQ
jgi:hypothetical protein